MVQQQQKLENNRFCKIQKEIDFQPEYLTKLRFRKYGETNDILTKAMSKNVLSMLLFREAIRRYAVSKIRGES